MKLHRLRVEGFRRLKSAEIQFGDATFLIGANNTGKSTVLHAIECLLSGAKKLDDDEYYSEREATTGRTMRVADSIVFEAEFRDLPAEAASWRGFRGRIFEYEPPPGQTESGFCVHYRKTFEYGKEVKVELRSRVRTRKSEFAACRTPQALIDRGAPQDAVAQIFGNLGAPIAKKDEPSLELLDEIWDIGPDEQWFQNPGGIVGNVLVRLPRFLMIPAESGASEIGDEKKGVLARTLSELFQDVRDASDNYRNAQQYLDLLAKELDPADESSKFGKMMAELNGVLRSVFADTTIHATTDLSDPDKVLVPSFAVEMSSNVRTRVGNQGTGMVRAAVFGLLRFRQKWLSQREDKDRRSLMIAFEEPEMYLHPSAANQMRDTIYDLSCSDSQIVATTHSPCMIDLSRKPRQVLNGFRIVAGAPEVNAFSVSDEYHKLISEERDHVKMLLRIDEAVARVFFSRRVLIVEGDTEEIVVRESVQRLPADERTRFQSEVEVVRARGKASIIGICRYLRALGLDVYVMHDRDAGVPGAETFNEPIRQAAGQDRVLLMEENMEEELGYKAPSNDRPFRAFRVAQAWGATVADIDGNWAARFRQLLVLLGLQGTA